jgi:hypothetical protein
LFGNGDGTFQTPITTLLNFSLPTVVVSAHFNGDGKVDVATAFSDTRIVDVPLSNGDGTLAYQSDFANGGLALVIGKLNVSGGRGFAG